MISAQLVLTVVLNNLIYPFCTPVLRNDIIFFYWYISIIKAYPTAVKYHLGEGTSLLCEGIEALGTQFPGEHRPAGVGIGRIQRVCLMQTRFRLPQPPPL